MVKFAHLLLLSALIVWIAGSGCVGNDASEMEEAGIAPNVAEAGNGVPADSGLTQAEIQELDSDMTELEDLLEDASLEDEIEIDTMIE